MISVSEHMITAVREALHTSSVGMQPIAGMDNHYCSLEKDREDKSNYKRMFTIQVDQKQVFIYLKI